MTSHYGHNVKGRDLYLILGSRQKMEAKYSEIVLHHVVHGLELVWLPTPDFPCGEDTRLSGYLSARIRNFNKPPV